MDFPIYRPENWVLIIDGSQNNFKICVTAKYILISYIIQLNIKNNINFFCQQSEYTEHRYFRKIGRPEQLRLVKVYDVHK